VRPAIRIGTVRVGALVACFAAWLTGCTPSEAESVARDGLRAAAPSTPVHLTDLQPRMLLAAGHALRLGDAWVVGGQKRDAAVAETPTPGERSPWIYHSELGSLPLPIQGERIRRAGGMSPIPLAAHDWGVVWGESTPPEWSGALPDWLQTELWMAVWEGEGWGDAQLLASGFHIYWYARGTIRARPETGTALMVPVAPWPGERGVGPIHFGFVDEGPLSPFTPAGAAEVPTASFDFVDDSTLVAAFVMHNPAGDDGFRLGLVTSANRGVDWSPVVPAPPLPPTRSHPTQMELRVDGDGVPHVLVELDLELGATELAHFSWLGSGAEWTRARVAPPSNLLRWSSGLDRSGHLTLAHEVLQAGEPAWTLHLQRWTGESWTEAAPPFPDMDTVELFSGTSAAGEWLLGWSGGRDLHRPPGTPAPEFPTAGLWLYRP
jgi:hypothetical protein